MSSYSRVNIYVGKYDIPTDGHIKLDDAVVRILYGKVTELGWIEAVGGEPWLIVQDGNFWPVMIRLDRDRLPDRLHDAMRRVRSFVGIGRPKEVIQRYIDEVLSSKS